MLVPPPVNGSSPSTGGACVVVLCAVVGVVLPW
jgi:hypothetical protein